MQFECHYDPQRDIKAVAQDGFLDLAKANAMSSLPANISNSELMYNGIEDPRSIGGRPSDTFDGVQMAKSITGYKAPESSEGAE